MLLLLIPFIFSRVETENPNVKNVNKTTPAAGKTPVVSLTGILDGEIQKALVDNNSGRDIRKFILRKNDKKDDENGWNTVKEYNLYGEQNEIEKVVKKDGKSYQIVLPKDTSKSKYWTIEATLDNEEKLYTQTFFKTAENVWSMKENGKGKNEDDDEKGGFPWKWVIIGGFVVLALIVGAIVISKCTSN
jgi:hypothetical protein